MFPETMPEVENIIPVFPVRDTAASKGFYIGKLGFTLDWDADTICSVSRDGNCLMLSQDAEAASPALAWIGLETDALIQQVIEQQLDILQEPKNDEFAYHMKIQDIDGNILWLGTERKGHG